MQIIKKLIQFPFSLLGLRIINYKGYVNYSHKQQQKMDYIVLKANTFYKDSLENRLGNLRDSEYLQYLELKYGGYETNVSATIQPNDVVRLKEGNRTGGDRMSVLLNNYSEKYSQYLKLLRHSNKLITILEVGILRGTGLAVWDEYFDNKIVYGFDYDLGNFEQNQNKLIELGAFQKNLPTLKFFDQFADNSKTLEETFGTQKIDVIIDDAYHSDESIINTFSELQPYLNESFVYFIEDNRTAWIKLQKSYPQYNFDYNDNKLTVVTKIGGSQY